ncbi:MAG: sugar transferase [Candidatus Eisenbacteria bacterium]|uniref:Sugar transferase n=1 Tax=Eiseniibacteriota bacterium TaxID=2212470 RepID=A0A948W403_UNCEI|nr:sugar transferase [Candidatus Eisenbacteria bacterium]MBU1947516.1 sugar transferase [Candidatus Eisenbacteria bacterium]MBU2691672.1 sugar transferase [Candidatus Eisenbacteria bacterium]
MPNSFYARAGKRILDTFISLSLLLAAGPLFLIIALAIKLDSRGPVFYRQERIGQKGRPFSLLKFRSMIVDAEHQGAGILVLAGDDRITRVGRILRKFSLDELPQIINVLGGGMSIIGPRPGLKYQTDKYNELQSRRLFVKPGITGWAQVNGRNSIPWDRRIELDIEYVDRISLGLDFKILCRTPFVVLGGEGQIAKADFWKERSGTESKAEDTAENDDGEGGDRRSTLEW